MAYSFLGMSGCCVRAEPQSLQVEMQTLALEVKKGKGFGWGIYSI